MMENRYNFDSKLALLWISLLGVLLALFMLMSFGVHDETTYTLNDVSYKQTTSDVVFDVKVTDIRKEKGKEDIYNVIFEARQNHIRVDKSMTATEFEAVVGVGNNTVSTQVSTLNYILPIRTQSFVGANYVHDLSFKRFLCFGQSEFTEVEVTALAPIILSSSTETSDNFDAVKLADISKSEKVALTTIAWDKSMVEDFRVVPETKADDLKDTVTRL